MSCSWLSIMSPEAARGCTDAPCIVRIPTLGRSQPRLLCGRALPTNRSSSGPRRAQAFVRAFQTKDRGASGLDINGKRPTSPAAWDAMKEALRTNNVKLIQQQELIFAAERGVPIVDIRPPPEYEAGHIEGAINIPLFRPIEGYSARAIARRAGFAFFGIFNGTEANPEFADEIQEATTGGKGAVLYCNMGGTMDATATNERGMQSRSLTAAYELTQIGIRNVSVLKGGFSEWKRNGRPWVFME